MLLQEEYLRGKKRINIEVKHGLDDGEDGEDNGGHGDGGEAGHPVYHASQDYHQILNAWTLAKTKPFSHVDGGGTGTSISV